MDQGYFKLSPLIPRRNKYIQNNMHYLSNNIFCLPEHEKVPVGYPNKKLSLQINKVLCNAVKLSDEKNHLLPDIIENSDVCQKRRLETRSNSVDVFSKSVILKRNNYFDEENRQIKKIDKNIIKSDLENLTKKYKNEELKHVSELEIKLIKRNSIVNRDEILKDSNLNNFHQFSQSPLN